MLKLTTPAAEEAVSLEQFTAHLHGVSEVDDPADLELKLYSAREYIEHTECRGRALVTSTWALTLAHWPCCNYIEIPLGNLQSVGAITYRQSDGTVTTWPSTEYHLERVYIPADPEADPPVAGDGVSDCGIGRVYLNYGKCWPSAVLDTGEPITITFTSGWDSAAHVPFGLRAAVLLVAAGLYENREGAISDEDLTKRAKSALIAAGTQRTVSDLCAKYADRRF